MLALKDKLGPKGMMVAYSDDYYLHGPPVKVAATTINAGPPLSKKVELRIGWGPAKSELVLPLDVDPETMQLPRGDNGRASYHTLWRVLRLA